MKIIQKRMLKYAKENMTGVMHTTLDPEGPGVVRIHMIPPAIIDDSELAASVVIINGQDILPINSAWAILLAEFIKEVNKYAGREIAESEYNQMLENTCREVRKVFPFLSKKLIKSDIYKIMNTFTQVARGEEPDEDIEYVSIGDYAEYMHAPHRMDLLVSSMVKNGAWHCNQKCVHCYAAGQPSAQEPELSTDEWKRVIDKCREVCIPQLTFTGGEPTMRDDLLELIDYAQWFVTRLNTNGIKLTAEYCEQLKQVSLDSCQITFYSCDEAIHNKLVGANQYSNTLSGIDNAIAAGISVSINTPLCTLNKDYVQTLQFLRDRGVRYVTCSGLITTGNATGDDSVNLQLSESEIEEILVAAVEFCHSNGMEISFTSPGWINREIFEKLGISEPNCGACLSNMAITPGGKVVPCQSYLSEEPLGDMLNDEWDDIWNSERCVERRDYSAAMLGTCPLRRAKA